MDKVPATYLAASFLTTRAVDEVAATYLAWVNSKPTTTTAVSALMKAARSSKNSATVIANANAAYTALENDPPLITSIAPSSGGIAGGTSVTLTGRDFTGTSALTFGGTAATSVVVVSDTSVTAVTPAQTAGAKNVVITTPAGSFTLTNGYTYV